MGGLALRRVGNFNPAAGGGGGVTFANVKLLCGFEGVDGAQTFADESSNARSVFADGQHEQIDTAQFKFGSSSALFDGSFDCISCNDSADWDFGADPFCLEAWVRAAGFGTGDRPILYWGTASAAYSFMARSTGALRFTHVDTGNNTTTLDEASASMSTNTWYHVAVDRDVADNVRVYIDGVVVAGPTSIPAANRNLGGNFRIGRNQSSATGWNGHIDEVRVIKGETPYGGAFTPPVSAFPRS